MKTCALSVRFDVMVCISEECECTGEKMSEEEVARCFDLLLGPLDPLGHAKKDKADGERSARVRFVMAIVDHLQSAAICSVTGQSRRCPTRSRPAPSRRMCSASKTIWALMSLQRRRLELSPPRPDFDRDWRVGWAVWCVSSVRCDVCM